jgi:hypothetical protein
MDSEIKEAPENVTKLSDVKRPSKLEAKKNQIFQDRVKRKMGEGKTEAEAIQSVLREDYDRLPVADKLKRVEAVLQRHEGAIAGIARGFQADALRLEQNDTSLADSMDTNFRAFQRILRKLGVSDEDQKQAVVEAREEIAAELMARATAAEVKKAQAVEEEKKKEVAADVDVAGEPPSPPTEATDFGG